MDGAQQVSGSLTNQLGQLLLFLFPERATNTSAFYSDETAIVTSSFVRGGNDNLLSTKKT